MTTARRTEPFHLMAKPAGPHCNLACRYCFYLEKKDVLPARGKPRMSEAVLEAYIRGVAESHDTPDLTYAWQGGEPTLAGLDFFRRVVDLERRHANGRPVTNALQTNGLLLDDTWCAFLAENGFLVGLSLDGPEPIHNACRGDKQGRGRWEETIAALQRLQRHGVAFNTLTAVHRHNARHPLDVYRFLRDSGVEHMQFIPIVERKPDARAAARGFSLAPPLDMSRTEPRSTVTPWSVRPDEYGSFLCAVFDEWVRSDVGRVFVQLFEVALGSWLGLPPALCVFSRRCGRTPVLESNGDVYACDHYVYPEYRRGNVRETALADILDHPEQKAFGAAKETTLPETCRACTYRFACNGGCPKHRFVRPTPAGPPVPYLCEGYRRFFAHADPGLRRIAALIQAGQPAARILQEKPCRRSETGLP